MRLFPDPTNQIGQGHLRQRALEAVLGLRKRCPFDRRIDLSTAWETTNCVVWNDRERIAEKQELIYEVAWIPELGIWRRFLRSRRKLPS
jgi:hypothetical protein